jgi:hypothetical protein
VSRSYAVAVTQSLAAQQTDEVYLELVEIDEASLPTPIRAVNNTQSIVSNGDTYAAVPFGINLAGESENEVETVRLKIDNVSRVLVDAVRNALDVPTVRLMIVRADDPDTLLVDMKFQVEQSTTTALTVEATLTYDNAYNVAFPRHRVTPQTFPAGPYS